MTNQQGAPEALRLADLLLDLQTGMGPRRPSHPDDAHCWDGYTQASAELRRLHAENERLAALVEAQQPAQAFPITVEQVEDAIGLQSTAWDTIGAEKIVEAVLRLANAPPPAPSAAAAVGQEPNFNLLRKALADRRFRGETDLQDLVNMAAHIIAEDGAILRARQTIIEQLKAAAQPSPTPQADSQPAPQGETNAQLDTDSNPSTPGQQRDVAGSVALGQPMGNGSDQTAGHPSAQGDKLLIVAERNIRSFLRSATFKSESDREAALNCVDVLWEAARAPADSVTAPAGWRVVPEVATIEMIDAALAVDPAHESVWEAYLSKAPTPPAQAADSVLEDAALLHYALADGGNQSMNWQDVYDDWSGEGYFIDALRAAYKQDAARKQGGA